MLFIVALSACAPSTSSYDARVADLERQVAELRQTLAARPIEHTATCKTVHDVSFPSATTFNSSVAFDVGNSDVRDGDLIVIDEVRGTRSDFAVDGVYFVRGHYTLTSADEAILGFNVSASRVGDACTNGNGTNRQFVKRGSGTFELSTRIAYVGRPHVGFYRAKEGLVTNADELGGVYFGKGEFRPR